MTDVPAMVSANVWNGAPSRCTAASTACCNASIGAAWAAHERAAARVERGSIRSSSLKVGPVPRRARLPDPLVGRRVRRLRRACARGHRQALLQQRGQFLLAHALAPACHRRAIKRQPMTEELLATEQLIIGVLQPALAQHLVRQVCASGSPGRPSAVSAAAAARAGRYSSHQTAARGTANLRCTPTEPAGIVSPLEGHCHL
jgi:hypothetical protein